MKDTADKGQHEVALVAAQDCEQERGLCLTSPWPSNSSYYTIGIATTTRTSISTGKGPSACILDPNPKAEAQKTKLHTLSSLSRKPQKPTTLIRAPEGYLGIVCDLQMAPWGHPKALQAKASLETEARTLPEP